MRKLFILSALLISFSAFTQQNQDVNLEKAFKIQAGTRGANVGYELPLSNKFLLDVGLGYGFVNTSENVLENYFSYFSPFAVAKVNYFVSRGRRASKNNRKMHNNAGSFIALQTKYAPNSWEARFGQVLLTELHWGQ